jgi:hypothetical protein
VPVVVPVVPLVLAVVSVLVPEPVVPLVLAVVSVLVPEPVVVPLVLAVVSVLVPVVDAAVLGVHVTPVPLSIVPVVDCAYAGMIASAAKATVERRSFLMFRSSGCEFCIRPHSAKGSLFGDRWGNVVNPEVFLKFFHYRPSSSSPAGQGKMSRRNSAWK